ncbi:hypothetical protein EOL70_20005 [Leucothrix sargassi]|nr:hypothetical protein EOL70_20005 [Leucothrix sargassi]
MTTKFASLAALLTLCSQSALANIDVNFIESAPKDRFVISNSGSCSLENVRLDIDLTETAGKLIFDTTSTGAGVEVFQPFEVTKGSIKVLSPEGVKDGDNTLALSIQSLPPGQSVSFTIDVDDTLKKSALGNIMVAGSEIENGLVKVSSTTLKPAMAKFNGASKASIALPACKA